MVARSIIHMLIKPNVLDPSLAVARGLMTVGIYVN